MLVACACQVDVHKTLLFEHRVRAPQLLEQNVQAVRSACPLCAGGRRARRQHPPTRARGRAAWACTSTATTTAATSMWWVPLPGLWKTARAPPGPPTQPQALRPPCCPAHALSLHACRFLSKRPALPRPALFLRAPRCRSPTPMSTAGTSWSCASTRIPSAIPMARHTSSGEGAAVQRTWGSLACFHALCLGWVVRMCERAGQRPRAAPGEGRRAAAAWVTRVCARESAQGAIARLARERPCAAVWHKRPPFPLASLTLGTPRTQVLLPGVQLPGGGAGGAHRERGPGQLPGGLARLQRVRQLRPQPLVPVGWCGCVLFGGAGSMLCGWQPQPHAVPRRAAAVAERAAAGVAVWQAGCFLWFPVAASRQREAGKLLYCGLLPSCRRGPMATSCSLVAREVPCHIMAPCPSLLARRVPTEYHEAEGVLSWTHTPTKGAVYYVSWSSAGWPAYMQGRRQAGCVQGTGAHV